MINLKKIIVILFVLSLIVIFTKKEDDIIIPNNAIRFRVIANSNSLEDQNKKQIIKNDIEKQVYNLIKDANNTSDVRNLIESNISEIDKIVSSYDVP